MSIYPVYPPVYPKGPFNTAMTGRIPDSIPAGLKQGGIYPALDGNTTLAFLLDAADLSMLPFEIQPQVHAVFPVKAPLNFIDSLKSEKDIQTLPPSDVVVFMAHPDDETICSGAILALRNKNYNVQLVYATAGENGKDFTNRFPKGKYLADARKNELLNATKELKVNREPVVLDFEDGKVSDPINTMMLSQLFKMTLRQVKPKMVITFGPDGMTTQADQKQVGHITDQVTRSYNAFLPADQKVKVYHMALTQSEADAFKKGAVIHQEFTPFIPEKIASLSMHQTQFSPEEVLRFLSLYRANPQESYVLANLEENASQNNPDQTQSGLQGIA